MSDSPVNDSNETSENIEEKIITSEATLYSFYKVLFIDQTFVSLN